MNTRATSKKKVESPKQHAPFEALRHALIGDAFWENRLSTLSSGNPTTFSVHLAVCVEPFLRYVLEGRKTVESRFSAIRCAAYGRIQSGDVVLLKRSGGPVVGICETGETWCYTLDRASWHTIRKEFAEALCAEDDEFWRSREDASYATLMRVRRVWPIGPIPWEKRDRRGWVIVQAGSNPTLFKGLMNSRVLGFAGGIKSGKSTVSEAVAAALGAHRVSFGNYVRKVARERGVESVRENLQAIGESLVHKDVRQFCAAVLAEVPWRNRGALVIDGIRHLSALEAVTDLVAPSEVRLVYVSLDEAVRERRYRGSAPDQRALADLDRHSTELDVKSALRERADLVVDGERPLEEMVTEITSWMDRLP